MACGNNHVTRSMLGALGSIAIAGALRSDLMMACGRLAVFTQTLRQPTVPGVPVTAVGPSYPDTSHTKLIWGTGREEGKVVGVDHFLDDQGNPRLPNEYPHIHHRPQGKGTLEEYFVQITLRPGKGPDPHPSKGRVDIYMREPDPGLVDTAVSILGALLRGEELH
jgi:hypothetical protein